MKHWEETVHTLLERFWVLIEQDPDMYNNSLICITTFVNWNRIFVPIFAIRFVID